MDSSIISPKNGYGTASGLSTATASQTSPQNAEHTRSEREKVIAGILGGLGGLLVLCIGICCAVGIVRRRYIARGKIQRREMGQTTPEPMADKRPSVTEQQIPERWPRSPRQQPSLQYTMRPLPREPRPAPGPPDTEPWVMNGIHHESPLGSLPSSIASPIFQMDVSARSSPAIARQQGLRRPPTPPTPRKIALNPFRSGP